MFQRTRNFSIPARNAPLSDDTREEREAHYREIRQQALASRTGILAERGMTTALAVTAEERARTSRLSRSSLISSWRSPA